MYKPVFLCSIIHIESVSNWVQNEQSKPTIKTNNPNICTTVYYPTNSVDHLGKRIITLEFAAFQIFYLAFFYSINFRTT